MVVPLRGELGDDLEHPRPLYRRTKSVGVWEGKSELVDEVIVRSNQT